MRGNRPSKRGRADIDTLDTAAGNERFNTASGYFDFRQLWHVLLVCNLLWDVRVL
ncbi:hypothetical protein PAMC26577_12840 [Caballeronia sordidicola]|uniref:Uncharacterized protein n=1 Tax=Caballeronia sordidicola TaxID=196367 RepID=A0A242MWM8_CABSO|nr:hypothetical protein PAMC26577_12840 [Caballeronia sordidicola]